MKPRVPPPWQEGKQTKRIKVINSPAHKLSAQNSVWNVVCEGCGWTAQFRTGREAGDGGWEHHKTAHHNKHTAKSVNTCDGAATRIFRGFVHNSNAQAAKLKGEAHRITPAVEPEGRDKK